VDYVSQLAGMTLTNAGRRVSRSCAILVVTVRDGGEAVRRVGDGKTSVTTGFLTGYEMEFYARSRSCRANCLPSTSRFKPVSRVAEGTERRITCILRPSRSARSRIQVLNGSLCVVCH